MMLEVVEEFLVVGNVGREQIEPPGAAIRRKAEATPHQIALADYPDEIPALVENGRSADSLMQQQFGHLLYRCLVHNVSDRRSHYLAGVVLLSDFAIVVLAPLTDALTQGRTLARERRTENVAFHSVADQPDLSSILLAIALSALGSTRCKTPSLRVASMRSRSMFSESVNIRS